MRSIKEECLSKLIPLGEAHLRRAIREFVEHYHAERNHQGLGNRLIASAPGSAPAKARSSSTSASAVCSATTAAVRRPEFTTPASTSPGSRCGEARAARGRAAPRPGCLVTAILGRAFKSASVDQWDPSGYLRCNAPGYLARSLTLGGGAC
ncbi:MAG: hypothetical protein R3F62_03880 [Planctomycetota bacterium]